MFCLVEIDFFPGVFSPNYNRAIQDSLLRYLLSNDWSSHVIWRVISWIINIISYRERCSRYNFSGLVYVCPGFLLMEIDAVDKKIMHWSLM